MDLKLPEAKSFNILNENYFGQKNKSTEQTTRTFLYLMNKHVPSPSQKAYPFCPMQNEVNSARNESPCVIYCNEITVLFKDSKTAMLIIKEIMRDDSFLKMLGSLNTLTQLEISTFYLIFQVMEKTFNNNTTVHNYIKINITTIIVQLLKNLDSIRDNYVIIVVGKMFRKIIKDKDLLVKILNVEVFNMLYSHGKSANFILSKEISNIFFYLFDNEKVCRELVAKFLEQQEVKFADMMIRNLHHYESIGNKKSNSSSFDDSDDKYYYMKRESLILLEKIMNNPAYDNFNQEFTNNVEILKLVMILLNNKSNQIVSRALTLLNFFFNDVETKNNRIKDILYSNKHNFEIFFSKHTDLPEIEGKKNLILYELERLGNLLNE